MAMQIDASFEDGVFVPATRPRLAHRERVLLRILPAVRPAAELGRDLVVADRGSEGSGSDLAVALDFHPDGC